MMLYAAHKPGPDIVTLPRIGERYCYIKALPYVGQRHIKKYGLTCRDCINLDGVSPDEARLNGLFPSTTQQVMKSNFSPVL